jgi:hypothetical protein
MIKNELFRVLIIRDDDLYIARGLEISIYAQASNMETLAKRFLLTFLHNKDSLMDKPAPKEVFQAWEIAENFDDDEFSFRRDFQNPLELRQAVA